ncbi:MAG: GNAT family N-acetyltransferase [bacterium]
MEENTIWSIKPFKELGPDELYDILRLRSEVFVVEQSCIFQDMDNLDQEAIHLQGRIGNKLAATARILDPGVAYEEPSIGRVVSSPMFRRKGVGIELMEKAIEETERLYGKRPIKIGAQLYLKRFYEGFGFEQCSEMYIEDEIPHIKMIRPL